MKDDDKNYKYLFNKIYSGSFLEHHLGHEVINFIKTDDNKRYIYVNAWGERNDISAEKTDYVFHIMYEKENYYQLVAISKVDRCAPSYYNKNPELEPKDSITFNGLSMYEIFHSSLEDEKAHLYTFVASDFYRPKIGIRIFFVIESSEVSNNIEEDNGIITIHLKCNPQRSRCYSKDEDINILDQLVDSEYIVKCNNDNVNIDKLDDEQCFSVISDRTRLEDSTSNQIAYFLNRDKKILKKFVTDFLGIKSAENDDKFEVVRERNNIDILIVSKNHVIVIENKIDSGINGLDGDNSQLKKYYEYITEEKYKQIPLDNKKFYVLEPIYSVITREELDALDKGKEYGLIYYHDLYCFFKNSVYNPYDIKDKNNSNFLYNEFKKTLQYISLPKAKQRETTAYIRLNQRIKELKAAKE